MFKNFLLYAKVARVQTLVMSILPCLLSYVYKQNDITNIKAFVLVTTSIVLYHLSANTISEYRDCIKGVDDPNSPGTKYRLITGIVPKQHILYLGLASFAIATICGISAVCISSPILLTPGIAGAGLAFCYSECPLGLKYKGLGEVAVFLGYGVLLGFSTMYSLTGTCSIKDILVFIPGALLIVCVLLANNIRDYYFDKGHTTTLTTIIGIKKSYILLYLLANCGYLMYGLLVYRDVLPKTVYNVFFTYPILISSYKYRRHPKMINIFGLLFVLIELIVITICYIK